MNAVIIYYHPESEHFKVFNIQEALIKEQEVKLCGYVHIATCDPALLMEGLLNGKDIEFEGLTIKFSLEVK